MRTLSLGGNLYRAALMDQLYVHLLRRYAKVRFKEVPLAGRMAEWQRRRLVQYLEAHLDRSLKLEEIAREVGVSVSGLIRKFQTEFGCAPHAYVLRQRLERARRLLGAREVMPLKIIATDCGFSDQSHLVRHFKRAFQQTPMEYRKTLKVLEKLCSARILARCACKAPKPSQSRHEVKQPWPEQREHAVNILSLRAHRRPASVGVFGGGGAGGLVARGELRGLDGCRVSKNHAAAVAVRPGRCWPAAVPGRQHTRRAGQSALPTGPPCGPLAGPGRWRGAG